MSTKFNCLKHRETDKIQPDISIMIPVKLNTIVDYRQDTCTVMHSQCTVMHSDAQFLNVPPGALNALVKIVHNLAMFVVAVLQD